MNSRTPTENAGFTMLEVMIVVAIIGVLVAMLVPAISGAQENSRTRACVSNLRQWGIAMNEYVTENDDMLPYEDRGEEAKGWECWYDVLTTYLNVSKDEKSVKVCPTVRRSNDNAEESYRMNSKLAESKEGSPYFRPLRKHSTLSDPDRVVVLFDGDTGGDQISFKGRWRLADDDVSYRHNNRSNFLFADWHVDTFDKKKVRKKSVNNEKLIWQPADMGPWSPKG